MVREILNDAGDLDEAIAHARAAVVSRTSDPVAYDLLGRALAMQGHLDEPAVQFERAIALEPISSQFCEDLATVQHIRGARGVKPR